MVRMLSSVLAATVLLFGAVAPAQATMQECPADIAAGRVLFGSAGIACMCKTSACNQAGDFCLTCSFLTGATFGVDQGLPKGNDIPYCATAVSGYLTRSGLTQAGRAAAGGNPTTVNMSPMQCSQAGATAPKQSLPRRVGPLSRPR